MKLNFLRKFVVCCFVSFVVSSVAFASNAVVVSALGKTEVNRNNQWVELAKGDKVYEGTMLSFENDIVVIRVNLKGRFKNCEVPYDSIKKIRLAVKF